VTWLLVGLGAGVGAACRWSVDSAFGRRRFPLGILVVNLLGSLLAGVLAGAAPGPAVASLLAVGLLGGFTTASTFAVDVLRLYQDGARREAVLDVALSVVPGLVLAAIGVAVGRAL
jgi:CrcB protein